MKLQASDSSHFHDKSHFQDDSMQNSELQPVHQYFKTITAGISKGLSNKSIKAPPASNNSLAPVLNYISTKLQVKFNGSCLKQDKVTFAHKKVMTIYIVYQINLWPFSVCKDFALENSLFGTVYKC